MLRRILYFAVTIVLMGCVGGLVYLNPQETTFRLTPDKAVELPVSLLILGATTAGAAVLFLVMMLREGRRALRDWRVYREQRAAERTAQQRAEARSLALAGNYNKARALMNKVTSKRDADVGDLTDYASIFMLEGAFDEAKRLLEEGQTQFGNDPVLLHALAKACVAVGDNGGAIAALDRALATYPSSLQMLETLRDCLFATEDWARASETQQRIVALRQDDPAELEKLLRARLAHAEQASPENRDALLKSILKLARDYAPAIVARAKLLKETGQERQAMRLLEKSVVREPSSELLDLIEELLGESQQQRAVKLYEKLMTAHPSNDMLRLRAARFLIGAGQPDRAEEVLAGLHGSAAESDSKTLLSLVYQQRGNTDLATEYARQAVAARQLQGES